MQSCSLPLGVVWQGCGVVAGIEIGPSPARLRVPAPWPPPPATAVPLTFGVCVQDPSASVVGPMLGNRTAVVHAPACPPAAWGGPLPPKNEETNWGWGWGYILTSFCWMTQHNTLTCCSSWLWPLLLCKVS